jgi:hypothetical protein
LFTAFNTDGSFVAMTSERLHFSSLSAIALCVCCHPEERGICDDGGKKAK